MNADRDPREVDYVELHATGATPDLSRRIALPNPRSGTLGTTVGDPIEANAAGEVFHRSDDLIVGSVKGNLGHVHLVHEKTPSQFADYQSVL